MTEKKLAAVTGGSRGIGFQICRDLAKEGFEVILTARNTKKGLDATEKLKDEGLDLKFHQLDILDSDSIENFYQTMVNDFGKLDVLINNAAILFEPINSGLSADLQEIKDTIETNVYGAVVLCQKIIPLMIKNNYGRIVNLSSGLGQLKDMGSGYFAYRLSKTALNAATKIFAAETSGYDIQINCVDPGWVKTDMGGSGASLTPEEGADTSVWLSSKPKGEPSGKFYKNRKIIDW
ncbi:MAG: SDR family oxidoreductase [Candidatus Marinimicrobia bacterium]|nr:SDR family oxidoreductase [Candidatus Neomarinimicrobiota bacterium]